MQWVKGIYSDLPNHLPKIFEPKPTIRVKDLSEVNIEQLLQETYTTTPIHTEKKLLDGSVVTVSLWFSKSFLLVHFILFKLSRFRSKLFMYFVFICFVVQSNSKICAVAKSDTGATNNSGTHVSTV